MVALGKQDTMRKNIVEISAGAGLLPLWIASMANTDLAAIKLLARETPGAMFDALRLSVKFKNDAVVSLVRKCLAACWENSIISAHMDLCDEPDRLQVF